MPNRAEIPWPLSSSPGRSPGESAGRLLNSYSEALGPNGQSPAVYRRVPGLTAFAAGADAICRGMIEINGLVWAVVGRKMVTIDSNGTVTTIGDVAGIKKVFLVRNNKKPIPDKVMVTENGAFVFTDTTITAYPDADLPVPCGVTFQDGYFIFPIADGRVFASELNDTAINSLTNTTAESKPDGLVAAIAFNNQLLLFGAYSLEFWVDAANETPKFPYSRSTAKARGLASTTAIAGHQDGFGGTALIWVADHNRVVRLNGYEPQDISPPDLDRLIEAVADKTALEAMVYVAGGAPRWVLSSLTWTWEFNLNTEKWNERESLGFSRWRGTQSVWAFGKWLIGDAYTSSVWVIDDKNYQEGTNELRFRIESGPVSGFPSRMRVGRADFDFASGVGIAIGPGVPQTDPQVQISWSDDGGSFWSFPLFRPLGRQGVPQTRIMAARLGSTGPRGRRYRLDVSDPVYVGLTRGVQSSDLRDN